jgi:hypothetical protein
MEAAPTGSPGDWPRDRRVEMCTAHLRDLSAAGLPLTSARFKPDIRPIMRQDGSRSFCGSPAYMCAEAMEQK